MTSRTTPVGILVIVLAGLIAVGCSAPTSAVIQALIDPAGTPAPTLQAGDPDAVDEAVATDSWWRHPDGYEMELPAGWAGLVVTHDQTDELMAAVAITWPGLAERMDGVLERTDARVSAIAGDLEAAGGMAPSLLVLARSTDGRRARELKAYVRDEIERLPGLASVPVAHTDVALPTKGVRFDYSIQDPEVGTLRVRTYLFRYGRQAYLVNFVAAAEDAETADAIFDEIANSLRFGV